MIPSLLSTAKLHACVTCGKTGRVGIDGFQYVTAPVSPYIHELVCAVACSVGCEKRAIEKAGVAA